MLATLLLAARCTLPTLTDGYVGFTVGHPVGWTLDYDKGVIEVNRDARTAAVVVPVGRGHSEQQVLTSLAATLTDSARRRGDVLHVEREEISGTVRGTAVKGRLVSRKGLVHGGWAPAASWDADRATIDAIAACWEPARGTPLVGGTRTASDPAGSTTWHHVLPVGWNVAGATSRGIDLQLDANDGVSFGYLTGMFGSQTPDGFASFVMKSAQHRDARLTAAYEVATEADALGHRWAIKCFEYTATASGRPIRAKLTVGVSNSWGSWSGMAALRMAEVSRWDALAAVTAVVQESIRILDAKPGKGLRLPANNPNETVLPSRDAGVDDRLSREWEAATLGFDETKSPTTGETYLMPLSSWDATGSDGAGYYRALPGGGRERLEVGE